MTIQAERIQNAINHIKTATDIDPWAMELAVEALESLLSAEPKPDEKDHQEQGETAKFVVKTGETCADAISRTAAIDALIGEARTVDSRYLASERIIHEADAVEAISMLPSVQPERKTGHWEIYVISMLDGEDVRRPNCGQRGCAPYWKYCPNCGEKKEEVQDGVD